MPAIMQVADVRYASQTRQLTSVEDELNFNAEMAAFRAKIPRHVRFVVAPGNSILVQNAQRRDPGQPIAAADLPEQVITDKHGNQTGSRLGWQLFEQHLHAGRILENYDYRAPTEG